MMPEQEQHTLKSSDEDIAARHAAIQKVFGLNRTYDERSATTIQPEKQSSVKTTIVLLCTVILIGLIVFGFHYASKLLDQKSQREYEAKKGIVVEDGKVQFAAVGHGSYIGTTQQYALPSMAKSNTPKQKEVNIPN